MADYKMRAHLLATALIICWNNGVQCSNFSVAISPQPYVAFEGPLVVRFNPGSFLSESTVLLSLHRFNTTDTALYSAITGVTTGSTGVEIPCGVLTTPGWHYVTLNNTHGEAITSKSFEAVLPSIRLKFSEKSVKTYSSDVTIEIASPNMCQPQTNSRIKASLQLLFQTSSNQSGLENKAEVATSTIMTCDIWNCRTFKLPCNLLVEAGQYRARLVVDSFEEHRKVVSESDVLEVQWTSISENNLKAKESNIFPCAGTGMPLVLHPPHSCSGASVGRLRLYAVIDRPDNSVLQPWAFKYIAEQSLHLRNEHAFARFDCQSFDQIYPAYCFAYVTDGHSGSVHEHLRKCLLTDSRVEKLIAASWSSWTSWGQCTSPCGTPGIRYRRRTCHRVHSDYYGHGACAGVGFQTKVCNPTDDECPVTVSSALDATADFDGVAGCVCGCRLDTPGIIIVHAPMNCSNDSAAWVVVAGKGKTVQLSVIQQPVDSLAVKVAIRSSLNAADAERGTMLFDSTQQPFSDIDGLESLESVLLISSVPVNDENAAKVSRFRRKLVLSYAFIEDQDSISSLHSLWESNYTRFWLLLLLAVVIGVFFSSIFILIAVVFRRATLNKLQEKRSLLMAQSVQTSSSVGFAGALCGKTGGRKNQNGCDNSSLTYNRLAQVSGETGPGTMSSSHTSGITIDTSPGSSVSSSHQVFLFSGQEASVTADRPAVVSAPLRNVSRNDVGASVASTYRRPPPLQGIPEVPEEHDSCSVNRMPLNLHPGLRSDISPSPQLHARHRSIGIQLNSPAPGVLRRGPSMGSSLPSVSGRASPTSADFEYDYTEYPQVGSYLYPDAVASNFDFIDIDAIIGDSTLMRECDAKTPTPNGTDTSRSSNSVSIQADR